MSGSTCPGNDPLCPCQDGAACHYRDDGGTKGFALPYDYARCVGRASFKDCGLVLIGECVHCLRRTSPGGERQSWISPHEGDGPCPVRIGPREGE